LGDLDYFSREKGGISFLKAFEKKAYVKRCIMRQTYGRSERLRRSFQSHASEMALVEASVVLLEPAVERRIGLVPHLSTDRSTK
jgi:hypothetical protein